MTTATVAEAHQQRLTAIIDTATTRGLRLWKQVDLNNLDASWMAVAAPLTGIVSTAQAKAVAGSDPYTATMAQLQSVTPTRDRVIVSSFVGIDGSGREVESLLHGAITTTKEAVGAGLYSRAMESGAAYLATMMATAIADLARSGDMVGATGKNFTRYVRVVSAGACSRCALLAGKADYENAFKRHPRCRCTSAPVSQDGRTPKGLHDSPAGYFNSLSKAEQDRVFTKAGAEAIRSGADVSSVISARRGATGISTSHGIGRNTFANSGRRMQQTVIGRNAAGQPVLGYVTVEGTTVRGSFARQQQAIGATTQLLNGARYSNVARTRLMPETIVSLTSDLQLRQVLLRDAGYMERPLTAYYGNGKGNTEWLAERNRLQHLDHQIAETFYRSQGIRL